MRYNGDMDNFILWLTKGSVVIAIVMVVTLTIKKIISWPRKHAQSHKKNHHNWWAKSLEKFEKERVYLANFAVLQTKVTRICGSFAILKAMQRICVCHLCSEFQTMTFTKFQLLKMDVHIVQTLQGNSFFSSDWNHNIRIKWADHWNSFHWNPKPRDFIQICGKWPLNHINKCVCDHFNTNNCSL